MEEQVLQLKQAFFQLGTVVKLLSMAGYQASMDENQVRAAVLIEAE